MARHRKLTQKFAGFPMFKLGTSAFTYPLTHSFTKDFVGLDGLALDLQFATDKTLTARKGPTPVFTRASSATFVGSNGLIQSNNVARFDHDPVSLACKGLLIEESRTNVCLQSGNFGTTWGAIQLNTTGTPAYLNVATAPDGTTTAEKLIANAVASTHQFRQDVTLVSGTTYSLTCYFKAVEQQFAAISVVGAANGNTDWVSLFNVSSTPSAGFFNGFTSTSVTNAGNGWIRCAVVFTATASGSLNVRIGGSAGTAGNNQSYVGDNSSGILVWGAQLEAGSFATSYIPTTTTSVIRSADVCSITGSDFSGMYNQPEGTLVTSSSRTSTNTNAFISHYSDNSLNNGFDVRYPSATQVAALMNVANSNQVAGMQVNITAGSVVKQAFSYKLNDCGYSVNGAATITDTSSLIPTATRMVIGNAAVPSTFLYLNGTVSSMRYFKKRLSNAKLQTLTV